MVVAHSTATFDAAYLANIAESVRHNFLKNFLLLPDQKSFVVTCYLCCSSHIARVRWIDRLKRTLYDWIVASYARLLKLNLFPPRGLRYDMSRKSAERLGRWTTRLYIITIITCIAVLSLHTVIQPEVLTKTFTQPSLDTYKRLLLEHEDELKCPCALISSQMNLYINIDPIFHPVREMNHLSTFDSSFTDDRSFSFVLSINLFIGVF